MSTALPHYGTGTWVLVIAAAVLAVSVLAAYVGRTMIRRGLREPFIVRGINHASERVVAIIKRPITVAVLDEVAEVLRTGHYTRNTASALRENHDEIKEMVIEKIKEDRSARAVGLVPFHDALLEQFVETALRVVLEVLADPRTDELVSDLLRDNIDQIRDAVRELND